MTWLVLLKQGNKKCTYCGSTHHDTKYCPKTWNGQGNLANRRCDYCGSHDHELRGCPKLK